MKPRRNSKPCRWTAALAGALSPAWGGTALADIPASRGWLAFYTQQSLGVQHQSLRGVGLAMLLALLALLILAGLYAILRRER